MAKGLRLLAAETGFSTATISRALNNSSSVTAQTRRTVMEAAERLGYTPNAAARALTTRRTRTIGAVIPTLEHSIFSTFINAIEDCLASSGYALVIATTDSDLGKEERRATELMNMGAEGLIVSGLEHSEILLTAVRARNVPVIATSIYDPTAGIPTVGYDNRKLGAMAAEYLHGLGHKRIGVIHGPLANNDRTRRRLAGVRDVYTQAKRLSAVECPLSVPGSVSAARQSLAIDPRPTAILCLSDVLALGVLFEAPRLGFNIPKNLSVMGFDDLEWAKSANPPLTTIALPVSEMGRHAARAMVDRLEKDKPIRNRLLRSAIVVRASTGKFVRAKSAAG